MVELIDHLNDTLVSLAAATRSVKRLPQSERRDLMYSMLCNQGKVITLMLELARQEEEEIASEWG